ncbi:hypothetical protein GW17_00039737 [Ensete ventricosum]|nr:hypothetical protein GW17_00039737 [Ensete ventricosum]
MGSSLILHGVKDEGSFEAHAPYLREAFDKGIKVVERGEEATTSPEGLSHPMLVVKGAEEVGNAEANSKYQDKAEGQRPRNFIRLMSMGFSSRYPKVRDFGLMQECSTKE